MTYWHQTSYIRTPANCMVLMLDPCLARNAVRLRKIFLKRSSIGPFPKLINRCTPTALPLTVTSRSGHLFSSQYASIGRASPNSPICASISSSVSYDCLLFKACPITGSSTGTLVSSDQEDWEEFMIQERISDALSSCLALYLMSF